MHHDHKRTKVCVWSSIRRPWVQNRVITYLTNLGHFIKNSKAPHLFRNYGLCYVFHGSGAFLRQKEDAMKPTKRFLSLAGLTLAVIGASVPWGNFYGTATHERSVSGVAYAQYEKPWYSTTTERERCLKYPQYCINNSPPEATAQKAPLRGCENWERIRDTERDNRKVCAMAERCSPGYFNSGACRYP